MSTKAKKVAQEFEYKTEMKQLLHLIVHSLYTHPEVFLRELISNASDALNKVRFETLTNQEIIDQDAELKIQISLDPKEKTFSIEDAGIGMTRDDLINKIGSIASSGTLEFLQKAKEEKQKVDGNLIGQFGVGFYSVFMVTEEIEVETRHAHKDSKGYRWRSTGEGKYTIEETQKETRGTRISFKLKKDHEDFAEEFRIKNIINKYSNFVDFPIYLDKEQINKITALWHRPKDELKESDLIEFYKFISNDFQPPLGHLPLSIEGAVNFKALIFIPENAPPNLFQDLAEKSLQLYSNKVMISDNCKDLLPEYLRFAAGVVDTEDLPLNVSREVTQNSPVMSKIRSILTNKILSMLEDWSKNDPDKYDKFYRNFGPLLKSGVNDFEKKDKIIDLLKFQSSKTEKDEYTTFKEYTSRMQKDQKEIYYLSGEHRDQLDRNPNLEYFREKDLEVFLLVDPIDVFTIPAITEYDGKPLKSIEKADLKIDAKDEEGVEKMAEGLASPLLKVFKETLGDRVEDVIESKRLVSSPVTLVAGEHSLDVQMEKIMKMMNKDHTASKKILEVNLSHPIIRNLARINMGESSDPLLRTCIVQLFEGALLMEGSLESTTEYITRMNELMEQATK